jgi:hypothetical protein
MRFSGSSQRILEKDVNRKINAVRDEFGAQKTEGNQ